MSTQTGGIADYAYRAHPSIANTDLTNLQLFLEGARIHNIRNVYHLGVMAHAALLEPEKPNVLLKTASQQDAELLNRMLRTAGKCVSLQKHLAVAEKETEVFWVDPDFGIPCKAKIDMVKNGEFVAELKTTSAYSEKSFLRKAVKTGYDRQLAFYADSLPAPPKQVSIFGLSKTNARQILELHFPFGSSFVSNGRGSYKTLLKLLRDRPELIEKIYEMRGL